MQQALTEWTGSVATLIAEMKRRAGVQTDQELARFAGAAQSTVSNWRKRGAIPEAALLRFEQALDQDDAAVAERLLAARTLALRLPELWYARLRAAGAKVGRHLPYSLVAHALNGISAEIARQLARIEKETGRSTGDLSERLMEDDAFMGGLVEWVATRPASDLLGREVAAGRRFAKLDQALPIDRATDAKTAGNCDS